MIYIAVYTYKHVKDECHYKMINVFITYYI